MNAERAILGFALAPLPVLGGLAVMAIVRGAPLEAFSSLAVLGYAATLVIGLPIHLGLTWLKRRGLLAYLTATFLAIVMPTALLVIGSRMFRHADENPFALHKMIGSPEGETLMAMLLGCACFTAGLFWWIAVRRTRAQQVEAVTPLTG